MTDRVEWIGDVSRLDELDTAWERLACRHELPFGRPAWVRSWWDAYGGGLRMETCVLWRGDELAGAFAAHREHGGLRAAANSETPAFVVPAADGPAYDRLVEEVVAAAGKELVVEAVPAGASGADALAARCRAAGRPPRIRGGRVSPIVECATRFPDFGAWRAETKPRWHVQLDRLGRKAARERGARYTLLESPKDLGGVLARGLEVERRGSEGRGQTPILSDARATTLWTGVARRLAAAGDLRVSWLDLDGRMAAFDLSFVHRGRLWLLKTGFDPAFRSLAPGLLLRLAVIERCFDEGLAALELLGEDDEWKRKFATTAREHVTVTAPRRASWRAARDTVRPKVVPLMRAGRRGAQAAGQWLPGT